MAYLYLREGELRVLGKSDIDVKRRTITVCRAWEARLKKVGLPKNGKPRTFQYEMAVAPLIEALMEEPTPGTFRGCPIPGGLLFEMPRQSGLAPGLREDLAGAGVTRAAIFTQSAILKRLTAHDLRASGITWRAHRGDNPYEMMNDAGHQNFTETQGYIRLAQTYGNTFGQVFPPVPMELCGGGYLARQLSADMVDGGQLKTQVPTPRSQMGSQEPFDSATDWINLGISVPKEGLEPSHPCE